MKRKISVLIVLLIASIAWYVCWNIHCQQYPRAGYDNELGIMYAEVDYSQVGHGFILSIVGGALATAWVIFIGLCLLAIIKKSRITVLAIALLIVSASLMQTHVIAETNRQIQEVDVYIDVLVAYDDDFDPSLLNQIEYVFWHANSFSGNLAPEDCFEKTFGIHFNIVAYRYWDSDDTVHDARAMVLEAWEELGFEQGMIINGETIEVLFLCTGQDIEGYYAVTFPDASIILIEEQYAEIPSAVRHELSHLFYCPDHSFGWGFDAACVMIPDLAASGKFISWCSDCEEIILKNKYRYVSDNPIIPSPNQPPPEHTPPPGAGGSIFAFPY